MSRSKPSQAHATPKNLQPRNPEPYISHAEEPKLLNPTALNHNTHAEPKTFSSPKRPPPKAPELSETLLPDKSPFQWEKRNTTLTTHHNPKPCPLNPHPSTLNSEP